MKNILIYDACWDIKDCCKTSKREGKEVRHRERETVNTEYVYRQLYTLFSATPFSYPPNPPAQLKKANARFHSHFRSDNPPGSMLLVNKITGHGRPFAGYAPPKWVNVPPHPSASPWHQTLHFINSFILIILSEILFAKWNEIKTKITICLVACAHWSGTWPMTYRFDLLSLDIQWASQKVLICFCESK